MAQLAKAFLFTALFTLAAGPALALTVSHITDVEMVGMLDTRTYVGEGRAGDGAGITTYEFDLGGTMGAPSITGDYPWVNGDGGLSWEIEYDSATDMVVFVLGVSSLQWGIPLSLDTEIFIRAVTARNDITVTTSKLVLDGVVVGDAAAQTGTAGVDLLWISGGALSDGFTLSGDLEISWTGATPSADDFLLQFEVGTLATIPTEEVSWGAVKALFR